LENNILIPSPY